MLYEHQSSIDPMMPFRVLVYMVAIWKEWRREHPDARALPPIVPVVLYHGERPWSGPTGFDELFNLEPGVLEALAPHLPAFRLLIDDLTRTGDDEIEATTRRSLATIALMMLKHATDQPGLKAVIARLGRHFAAVAAEPGGVEALVSTLYYLYSHSNLPPDQVERLVSPNLDPTTRGVIMTTAQRLFSEGEAKGKAEGKAEGEAKGKAEGLIEGQSQMLLKALRFKFGEMSGAIAARVEAATEAERDRWLQRAFVAKTLDEVFEP